MTVAIKKIMGIANASIKKIISIGSEGGAYTKALLHFNGSDASTTFTDESGKTWTARGTAQLDTAQKVFGTASMLLDGNSDWIDTPSNADLCTPGTGNFTIDFWVRFNATSADQGLCSIRIDGSNCFRFRWDATSGNTNHLKFIWIDGGAARASYEAAWTPSTNTWYHVAAVRNGTNFYLFIDGNALTIDIVNTAIGTNTLSNINSSFYIGQEQSGVPAYLNGWMDEFRYSKGIARWTANFTPPASEHITNKLKKYQGISNV